ncbi:MAG: carboxypeptidase-like regulatory domain-containing protein, partial [Planctomycetota bacterium]
LEKLRERLGRGQGSERRMRALSLLAGVPASGAAVAIGGILVGAKTKVALAAAVLAAGLFLVWRTERTEGIGRAAAAFTTEESASSAPELVSAASESSQGVPVDEGARRESVAEPSAPAALALPFPAEPSYVQRLVGRVRDEYDLPLAGAQILLAPHGFPFNLAATTDDEGRFAVDFATRRPVVSCALLVQDSQGQGPGVREVEFSAGQTFEIDVALRAAELEAVSIVMGDGGVFEFALSGAEMNAGGWLLARGLHVGDVPEMGVGPDGTRVFVESWPPVACPGQETPQMLEFAEESMIADFSGAMMTSYLSLEGGDLQVALGLEGYEAAPEAETTPPAPEFGRVRGIVRDPGGQLIAGAEVGYGPPGQRLVATVTSDEQGVFELADVPSGEWRLRARGPGGEGRCDELLTLAAGDNASWNPLLERGHELIGRVLLPDGAPLAASEIELWNTDGRQLYRAVARTNEDGHFAFAHLASGDYELHVRTEDARFPTRIVTPVLAPGDVGTLQLTPSEVARHKLVVALEDADGQPLSGGKVRLWHAASGRGLELDGLDENGQLTCDGLPRGLYRVEVGGALGWRDLGTSWIEADLDLGRVRFARPGLLSLAHGEPHDERAPVGMSLWRVHPDVLARIEQQDELGSLRRAALAGDYVLCLGAGDERQEAALTITNGRTTALELDGTRAPRPSQPQALSGTQVECSTCHED